MGMDRYIIFRCGEKTKHRVPCLRRNCQFIGRYYSTSPAFCLRPACLWPWDSVLEDAQREEARQAALHRTIQREDARGAHELQIGGQVQYQPDDGARVTEYRGCVVEEDVEQDERAPRSPGRRGRQPQENSRVTEYRGVLIEEFVPRDRAPDTPGRRDRQSNDSGRRSGEQQADGEQIREQDTPRRRDRRRTVREQQSYEREQRRERENRRDEARIRDFDAAALQRFNAQGTAAMMQSWVFEQADLDSRGRRDLLAGAPPSRVLLQRQIKSQRLRQPRNRISRCRKAGGGVGGGVDGSCFELFVLFTELGSVVFLRS